MAGSVKDGGWVQWQQVGSVHGGQEARWAEAYVKQGGAWVKIWPAACPAPTDLVLSASGTDDSLHPMATAQGADEYRFRHRQVGAANWTTLAWQAASDTMLTGLTGGTVHEVCVKARKDCGHTQTETDWVCRQFTVNQSHDLALAGRLGLRLVATEPVQQNLSVTLAGRLGIDIAATTPITQNLRPTLAGRLGIDIGAPRVDSRRIIPRAPTNPTINFVGA